MARYIVNALSLDQSESSPTCTIAVSVFDLSGSGITNLSEDNFAVHNITSETPFTIAELQSSKIPGFYRLLLRTEPTANVKNCVLALAVTVRLHGAGHVAESIDSGHTMVKVRAA